MNDVSTLPWGIKSIRFGSLVIYSAKIRFKLPIEEILLLCDGMLPFTALMSEPIINSTLIVFVSVEETKAKMAFRCIGKLCKKVAQHRLEEKYAWINAK